MGDPYATSTFLDSSCFSILYPLYRDYYPQPEADAITMNQSQAPSQQYHTPAPGQKQSYYRIGPTGQQNILSSAIGIPVPVGRPPFAVTDRQGEIAVKHSRATQASLQAPVDSSFISRMYSAQIPGQCFPANRLIVALEKEFKNSINADDYFVGYLFPTKLLPEGMTDEAIIEQLSMSSNGKPAIWDRKRDRFVKDPSKLDEDKLAVWLNNIGTTLGNAFHHETVRIWSHGCRNTPPVGGSPDVLRKPDLVLLDKKYYDEIQVSNERVDWAFIHAFAEVTCSQRISQRIVDTVNTKAFLMFLCQPDRRFVVALTFTSAEKESFRLTVTDREGQIRWTVGLGIARSKERAKLFFRILVVLMFGRPQDIGRDPNMEIDGIGNCVAITHEEKRFVVERRIYSLDSVVGRGTRVYIATHGGKQYTLKDCWIQHERVGSEVKMLKKMGDDKFVDNKLTGCVPTLFCGGDVHIDGVVDSTAQYRTDLPGWRPEGNRIHRRLVCTPIGEALTDYRSKKEFIKAISSIIRTHRTLYNEYGILHRDISLNNLLLYRPKVDEVADGLLIDFDYSEELELYDANEEHALKEREASMNESADEAEAVTGSSSNSESTGSDSQRFGIGNSIRTGTPPFMAIEALLTPKNNFAHHPRHDLESILYVILYICTFTFGPGPRNQRPDHATPDTLAMKHWFATESISVIGSLKVADMCQYRLKIIPGFTGYWNDFVPFALELLDLCFPPAYNPACPNKLKHEQMLSILDRAYDAVKESPTTTQTSVTTEKAKNLLKRNESSDPPVPTNTKKFKRKLERV